MKTSIIIPTFNAAHTLPRAITSVLLQTKPAHEIIIADDGSTDETRQICTSLPVRYHCQENAGVATARNVGLALATGEAVAFLDADDEWMPNYLAATTAALEARADFVCVNAYVSNGKHVTHFYQDRHPITTPITYEDVATRRCNIHSSVTAKREAVIALAGFDKTLIGAEDWDLWLRALKAGYTFHGLTEPLLTYYRSEATLSSPSIPYFQQVLRVCQSIELNSAADRYDLGRFTQYVQNQIHLLTGKEALREKKWEVARAAFSRIENPNWKVQATRLLLQFPFKHKLLPLLTP